MGRKKKRLKKVKELCRNIWEFGFGGMLLFSIAGCALHRVRKIAFSRKSQKKMGERGREGHNKIFIARGEKMKRNIFLKKRENFFSWRENIGRRKLHKKVKS